MKMIRKTITKTFLWLMLMALVVVSCGTKKTVVDNSTDVKTVTGTEDAEQLKLNYMRRVYDNAVYTQNIVSNIDFSIDTGSKDISVGGSLHMRKDDVIRIQLTAFGLMEVGRLEFTKDYVMIVDRIHKEYIKADYNKVGFLQRNGLNFYSLQALFWNMLFMPGTKKVTDDMLKQFALNLQSSSAMVPVNLKQGNMSYVWQTESKTGQIKQTEITYADKSSGTTKIICKYDDFKPVGTKMFPHMLTLNGKTQATQKPRDVKVGIKLKGVKMDKDWETRTTLSGKYKAVSVEEVLEKITSL
jgi:hypothetical protein